ncbi:MAG: hypothetical protein H6815_00425 [Phycisphaeraceae bacterium]|nr:hypothetical protein [Phycisphaerales bacterium]MCB9858889.1 hypothetical protein [Phycisphaeraceae bacterium]
MAGNLGWAVSPEIALVSGNKAYAVVTSPSNYVTEVNTVLLSFDGTVASDAPLFCRVARVSSAGSGSSVSNVTVGKRINGFPTINTTVACGAHDTSDPTLVSNVAGVNIHPRGGGYTHSIQFAPVLLADGERLAVFINNDAGLTWSVVITVGMNE